jgi:hypothetical protein
VLEGIGFFVPSRDEESRLGRIFEEEREEEGLCCFIGSPGEHKTMLLLQEIMEFPMSVPPKEERGFHGQFRLRPDAEKEFTPAALQKRQPQDMGDDCTTIIPEGMRNATRS